MGSGKVHGANTLYFGDNLRVLRENIADESVDLVYLDPPFKSDSNYNLLFKKGRATAPAQILTFKDTWSWTTESESAYAHLLKGPTEVAAIIKGMRESLGTSSAMAYNVMMGIRLIELHRVLKSTGSLYLHCDPTASHYIKVLLDAVFGPSNFRNEVTWKRSSAHNDGKRYGNIADTILFYTKSEKYTWNVIHIPYTDEYIRKSFVHKDGRGVYKNADLTAEHLAGKGYKYEFGGHMRTWTHPIETMRRLEADGMIHWPKKEGGIPRYKIYLKDAKGVPLQNVWTDIQPVSGAEKTGYQTQKPLKLLDRILRSSSNPGDTVLDPFCGCGTTVHAAQHLGRKWIGIDITHLAISLIETRMDAAFGERPAVVGLPTTIDEAEELARRDRFQFERWAVTAVPGVHPNQRQVADGGADAIGYMEIGLGDGKKRMEAKVIVSVKSGKNLNPAMVRELAGSLDTLNADLGVFVCLGRPSRSMMSAAASSGVFTTPVGAEYPRVQIYTMEDHFRGAKPLLPTLIAPPKVVGSRDHGGGSQRTMDGD